MSDFHLTLPSEGLNVHAYGPESVANFLRETISAGRIRPGAKLPEVQLTSQLKVSRHTLRSAFQILAEEGLVERQPNRGVFVHTPTADDIREIYRTRRIVQTGVVRTVDLTEADLSRLWAAVTSGQEALKSGDETTMAWANQEFHREFVALARTRMLSVLMDQILARMRLVFLAKEGDGSYHAEYVTRNLDLARLLTPGREQEAEAALLDYLDHAESQLLARLDEVGPDAQAR